MNIVKAVLLFLYCYAMLKGIVPCYAVALIFVVGLLFVISTKHSHEATDIDYIAYNSRLYNVNPFFKIIFFITSLIICVLGDNIWVSLFTFVSMGFITLYLGGVKWHTYKRLLILPLFFLMASTITIAVDINNGLYLSHTGQIRGIILFIKAMSSVTCLYALALSTPLSDIIEVLRFFKVPNIIIELMFLIYRFIFILSKIINNMLNSAKIRYGFNSFKNMINTYSLIAGNLLINTLKKSNDYYDSLLSRKYKGNIAFYCNYDKIKLRDILFGAIYLIIVGGLCFL